MSLPLTGAFALLTADSATAVRPAHASTRPPPPASSANLARIRACESGGNYGANTGNGYYGAYQMAPASWRSLGMQGWPHQASPATQDQAAIQLHSRAGWAPWPACSRRLGLR